MEARKPIPWRECEFVSMANAARIAGRSPAWVRRALCIGDLQARTLPTGGPPVVTVASLAELLDASQPAAGENIKPGVRRSLRLVTSEP